MQFDQEMLQQMSKTEVQQLATFGHYINGEVWADFSPPKPPAPGEAPNVGVTIRDDLPIKIFYDHKELGPDGRLDSLWVSDIDPMNLGPEHKWFIEGTPFAHMLEKKQNPQEFLDDPEAVSKWGPLMDKSKKRRCRHTRFTCQLKSAKETKWRI
eukprot:Gregarina_sp_Poly_1__11098@NODE_896_length_5808_cov_26_738025_g640_i0_p3_GENE_NODE_896_length_5808_cov_26_738025_g640_i0NODE_896_length_5808_cov_26_738025_g640_i0_p3_ORF_typecomplete_len154_score33_04_NODE_896_length_5808_cov_26_738025_g640_i017852246